MGQEYKNDIRVKRQKATQRDLLFFCCLVHSCTNRAAYFLTKEVNKDEKNRIKRALQDDVSELSGHCYGGSTSRNAGCTDEAPAELRIATTSFQIGNGLEQQIEQYLTDFPQTKLVIIDTFQKVRDSKSTGGKSGMYAGDYDDVSALKNISDKYGIAVVVVHHVRKLKDATDPFNEVSGSTGITGAADTNFVLKRSRSDESGTLLATGRDIEYQELTLKFDNRTHLWELVERKDMEDIRREEIPKFVFRLVDFVSDVKEWQGTATELVTQMNETEVTPNVVTKMLARFSAEVFMPQGIEYKTKRTGTSRLIYLKKRDGNDGDDNKSSV